MPCALANEEDRTALAKVREKDCLPATQTDGIFSDQ